MSDVGDFRWEKKEETTYCSTRNTKVWGCGSSNWKGRGNAHVLFERLGIEN